MSLNSAKGSTLPSYKYLFPSEAAGVGLLVTSAGVLASKDTYQYRAGSITPWNTSPGTPTVPQTFTIRAQNAAASYAAPGGDINMYPGTGSVSNPSGNFVVKDTAGNGGTWNTSHLVMGIYHIWVDSSGRLRIKNSTPASDTDGTIVGTQS